MTDYRLLSETLSEFARTLVQRFAIGDVLHDLVERVSVVLRTAGAGVALQEGDRIRFVAAVDERITALERIQEHEQAGPCVDAWRRGEVVAVVDLGEVRTRWGPYVEAAREVGIVAVAGIPMRIDSQAIGALDVYCASRTEWSDDDLTAARVLADVATSYVVNASELDRQRRTAEQLQEALDSRIVIEQAKGILAAERGITVDDAFELLRRHARNQNTSLRTVAEGVVNLGLRP